jgi:hypothetical protein
MRDSELVRPTLEVTPTGAKEIGGNPEIIDRSLAPVAQVRPLLLGSFQP